MQMRCLYKDATLKVIFGIDFCFPMFDMRNSKLLKIKDTLNRTGGTFNNYSPKTNIDILCDRARQLPGPGMELSNCTYVWTSHSMLILI